LLWAAPGPEADARLQPDWRPVPHAYGTMPRAAGQFRPQRRAAPPAPGYGRFALPSYAAAPGYPLPSRAWRDPRHPATYNLPQYRHAGPGAAARPVPPGLNPAWAYRTYPGPAQAVPRTVPTPALPQRVSWNRPDLRRFRPVTDPRAWTPAPNWRTAAPAIHQPSPRYPGRMGGPAPTVRMAPPARHGVWQGKTVFRPVPGAGLPQYAAQHRPDPRFRPLPPQYRERRMAQDWRPVREATLPGWLTTESSSPAWRTCDLCTGS
jgi:hypothetical protein